MKKTFLSIALALMAGAVAQAQPVYSNAVGMIKISVTRGEYNLIYTPFSTNEGSDEQTVSELLGNIANLPAGTQVLAWNKDLQEYESSTYVPVIGGWTPATLNLDRGRGFFISIPASPSDPVQTFDVVLSGVVPDDQSKEVSVVTGFQFMGFPYPTDTNLSEMTLSDTANIGDTIYIWSNASGWISSTFVPVLGGWTPDLSVSPGTAFMYKSSDARSFSESQPYSLD